MSGYLNPERARKPTTTGASRRTTAHSTGGAGGGTTDTRRKIGSTSTSNDATTAAHAIQELVEALERAVIQEQLRPSRGRGGPCLHPAALELVQGLVTVGGTDHDTLSSSERYHLPENKKLVVGKYVPDPKAIVLKKVTLDELAAEASAPLLDGKKEAGPTNGNALARPPPEDDFCTTDSADDETLLALQKAKPKKLVFTELHLVKPKFGPPLTTSTLYFPIYYAPRLTTKEKNDPRGPSRGINDANHVETIHPQGSIKVQKDNLHKMCLYKIGPGAVAFKVVINAFETAGMKYTPNSDWNVMWAKRASPELLALMDGYQRINHFLGAWGVGRKDNLHKNIKIMKSVHGSAFDIVPPTFVIPAERQTLERDVAAYTEAHDGALPTYICKPVASSCGKGIHLVKGMPQNPPAANKSLLVQRYIGNPMLIEGRKFDLRIYVAVTSFDPLRIYIFDQGLVRFAAEKYPGPDIELDNIQMHLTNYSVNKTAQLAKESEGKDLVDDDPVEVKWLLTEFYDYIKNTYGATDPKLGEHALHRVKSQVDDIVIKTLLTVEVEVINQARAHSRDGTGRECFELYGFDLLLDDELRAYLLEVNIMPSLATGFSIDKAVKGRLLSHLLNLIGVVPHDRRKAQTDCLTLEDDFRGETRASRTFSAATAVACDVRYAYPNKKAKPTKGQREIEAAATYVNEPLLSSFDPVDGKPVISAQELAVLIESDEELFRAGGYRRVFPTATTAGQYFSLFRHGVLRRNYLLGSWEAMKGTTPGPIGSPPIGVPRH